MSSKEMPFFPTEKRGGATHTEVEQRKFTLSDISCRSIDFLGVLDICVSSVRGNAILPLHSCGWTWRGRGSDEGVGVADRLLQEETMAIVSRSDVRLLRLVLIAGIVVQMQLPLVILLCQLGLDGDL